MTGLYGHIAEATDGGGPCTERLMAIIEAERSLNRAFSLRDAADLLVVTPSGADGLLVEGPGLDPVRLLPAFGALGLWVREGECAALPLNAQLRRALTELRGLVEAARPDPVDALAAAAHEAANEVDSLFSWSGWIGMTDDGRAWLAAYLAEHAHEFLPAGDRVLPGELVQPLRLLAERGNRSYHDGVWAAARLLLAWLNGEDPHA